MTRLVLLAMGYGAMLCAQSSSSPYGVGPVWWNAGQGGRLPWEETYENPEGEVGILNTRGLVRTDGHAFFEALGTNRRACVTCHQPSNGMGISTATLRERWNETGGRDPVFAAVDGSNCPDLPQSDEHSHSLLLERGLFRIVLPQPKAAEFRIEVVRDPTGCNRTGEPAISVFRRPRIVANLESVSALMADGREPSLPAQAVNAAAAHEQAETEPKAEQLREIVDFETQIFAAQSSDIRAGRLNEQNGPLILGPDHLANGTAFRAGSLDAWRGRPEEQGRNLQRDFRASVARGSEVFFGRTFRSGANAYTCATCHSAGAARWMDIGTTNVTPEQALPDLPLFRITCDERVFYTQDPGRGWITGKCADVGSIVPQQLRALAARAPYFSNGSARTLREVIEFYERRYHIRYSARETQDLINFLKVL